MLSTRRTAAVMLAMSLLGSAVVSPPPTVAASDLLPNLRMVSLHDFKLQWSGGRRLLRFTAIMTNGGPGPFEVRGSRPNTSEPLMTVRQLIANDAGGARTVATDAMMHWGGDGHNHWHTQDMMFYQIWPSNGGEVRRDEKVGFCFLDTNAVDLSLPHARQSPYYKGSWCGTQSSLSNRVGISVGWGDSYPWNFALQWLDVTGLAPGSYIVRAKVDPHNFFLEASDQNNCTWTRINLPSSGTAVQVTGSGYQCKQPPVQDFPGATQYVPPRTLSFAGGTHTGYRFSASGAIQEQKIATLGGPSSAQTLRLSAIPGQTGEWFFVDNGVWADYWLKKSSRVKLAP